VFDLHREFRHGFVGRRAQGAAVAQVEAGAVQDAGDAAFGDVDVARGQFEFVVGAFVLDRVEVAVEIDREDRDIVGPDDGFSPGRRAVGWVIDPA
jgi:hypothetical protein